MYCGEASNQAIVSGVFASCLFKVGRVQFF